MADGSWLSLPAVVRNRIRWMGYRSYYWLVALNYRYQFLARTNTTPAGSFRCYELLNRHGTDPMLQAIDRYSSPDAVVYDIGSHVGIYSLALAVGSNRSIHAFEPSPVSRYRLRKNIVCNDIQEQITVHEYGLGSRDTTAEFFCSTYPELSAFEQRSATRWEASVRKRIRVQMSRLDSVAEIYDKPTVLKVDVEGGAAAVLRGAKKTLTQCQPAIFIEIHDQGFPAERITELQTLLDGVNYEVERKDGFWKALPAG